MTTKNGAANTSRTTRTTNRKCATTAGEPTFNGNGRSTSKPTAKVKYFRGSGRTRRQTAYTYTTKGSRATAK